MAENNTVRVTGMLGEDSTYFADNPVIITVDNLDFPAASAIKVVRVQVLVEQDGGSSSSDSSSSDSSEPEYTVVGEFSGDVAGTAPYSITFDISSALRSLWAEETFAEEVNAAKRVLAGPRNVGYNREQKAYGLRVMTEYIDQTDGTFVTTVCRIYKDGKEVYVIPAGSCIIGGRTEWERSLITDNRKRDVSSLEHTNPRNGDASTKPTGTPELVGSGSLTSWVDVSGSGTKSIFYRYDSSPEDDDPASRGQNAWQGHAPIVMRDTVPYVDFLFVNRRGAVETCSAQMLEALDITVETRQSTRVETPTYKPSRTIMATATGGRRSWAMSSGYQTREWAEWWTLEFLMARRHWMCVNSYAVPGTSSGNSYVPVTVTPAKKATGIYDRTKQELASVEFTVTLALEG